jgi:hypothetical protein
LSISTQNYNESWVSGSTENAPNYKEIQLNFISTLTKKRLQFLITYKNTLLVVDIEVEVIFKVDLFDDVLSP